MHTPLTNPAQLKAIVIVFCPAVEPALSSSPCLHIQFCVGDYIEHIQSVLEWNDMFSCYAGVILEVSTSECVCELVDEVYLGRGENWGELLEVNLDFQK